MRHTRFLLIGLTLAGLIAAGCSRGGGRNVIQPAQATAIAAPAATSIPAPENAVPTAEVQVAAAPTEEGVPPTAVPVEASPTIQSQPATQPASLSGASIDPQVDQGLNDLDQELNAIQKTLNSTDTLDDFK
jgi:hypothetical protein